MPTLSLKNALVNGLKADPRLGRTVDFLADAYNFQPSPYGAADYEPLQQPINAAVTIPFPQLFIRETNHVLLDDESVSMLDQNWRATSYTPQETTAWSGDGVYTPDPTTINPGGGIWQFANIGDVWFTANQSNFLIYNPEIVTDGAVFLEELSFPRAICAHRGRIFFSGLTTDGDPWDTIAFPDTTWRSGVSAWTPGASAVDLKLPANSVCWTSLDAVTEFLEYFFPWQLNQTSFNNRLERNEGGHITLPDGGAPIVLKPLSNGVMCYGYDRIYYLRQVSEPPTMGFVDVAEFGVAGPGAVAGSEAQHTFMDRGGELWKITADLVLTKIGYRNTLENLVDQDVMVVEDPQSRNVHISNAEQGYLLTDTGLARCSQVVTSIGYREGQHIGVYSEDKDNDASILTDVIDFDTRQYKTINGIDLSSDDAQDFSVRIYFRNNAGEDFRVTEWVTPSVSGNVQIGVTAVDFMFEVSTDVYSNKTIEDLQISWSISSKRRFSDWLEEPLVGGGKVVADGVFNNLTVFGACSIATQDGINYTPGSDVDVDVATVDVTGDPTLKWDESIDSWVFTHSLMIDGGYLGVTADPDLLLLADGAVTIDGTLDVTDITSLAKDLRVEGDIGQASDTDLIQLASGALTINGTLNPTGIVTCDTDVRIEGDLGITADSDLIQMASGAVTLNGNLTMPAASALLSIGENDVAQGRIYLYGTATTAGPSIRLYNAGDEDTNTSFWQFKAAGDDLILSEDASARFTFNYNGNLTIYGDLTVNGNHIGPTGDSNLLSLAADLLTVNGGLTLTADLLVDGGDIGLTADSDLLQLANGALTINGTVALPTSTGITYGAGPDQDTNIVTVAVTGTPIIHWDETINAFQFTHRLATTAIVASGDVSGSSLTTIGTISGGSIKTSSDIGIPADTDLLQLASNVLTINGAVTTTGNILVDGGDIGITADTNLIQLASGALTINGTITAGSGSAVLGNLKIGVDDTTRGSLFIYGDSTTGGAYQRWFNSADEDGSEEYFQQAVGGTDFVMGFGGAVDFIFDNSGGLEITGSLGVGIAPTEEFHVEGQTKSVASVSGWAAWIENEATGGTNSGLLLTAGEDSSDTTFQCRQQDGTTILTLSGSGILELANGFFLMGAAATNKGALTLFSGSGGSAPGYARVYSPNGTPWFIFVEDDGTFKIHSAAPTANGDGTVVGTQT